MTQDRSGLRLGEAHRYRLWPLATLAHFFHIRRTDNEGQAQECQKVFASWRGRGKDERRLGMIVQCAHRRDYISTAVTGSNAAGLAGSALVLSDWTEKPAFC
jgi:hypothetical protein